MNSKLDTIEHNTHSTVTQAALNLIKPLQYEPQQLPPWGDKTSKQSITATNLALERRSSCWLGPGQPSSKTRPPTVFEPTLAQLYQTLELARCLLEN